MVIYAHPQLVLLEYEEAQEDLCDYYFICLVSVLNKAFLKK
jgi:hypothetical protein